MNTTLHTYVENKTVKMSMDAIHALIYEVRHASNEDKKLAYALHDAITAREYATARLTELCQRVRDDLTRIEQELPTTFGLAGTIELISYYEQERKNAANLFYTICRLAGLRAEE